MDRKNLNYRIKRIIESFDRKGIDMNKALKRASNILRCSNQELINYSKGKTDISSGLSQSILATRGENINEFEGDYAGAFVTFYDKRDLSFKGYRAGVNIKSKGENVSFEGDYAGLNAEFEGENAGLNAKFEGYNAGSYTKFKGENAGLNAKFKGIKVGLNANFEGINAGYYTGFEGKNAGENVSFEGYNAGKDVHSILGIDDEFLNIK